MALGSALAGVGGLALLPFAYFEPNVVNMRDPATESVQAFNDLLDQKGVLSPWFANAVEPDLERAQALAAHPPAGDGGGGEEVGGR